MTWVFHHHHIHHLHQAAISQTWVYAVAFSFYFLLSISSICLFFPLNTYHRGYRSHDSVHLSPVLFSCSRWLWSRRLCMWWLWDRCHQMFDKVVKMHNLDNSKNSCNANCYSVRLFVCTVVPNVSNVHKAISKAYSGLILCQWNNITVQIKWKVTPHMESHMAWALAAMHVPPLKSTKASELHNMMPTWCHLTFQTQLLRALFSTLTGIFCEYTVYPTIGGCCILTTWLLNGLYIIYIIYGPFIPYTSLYPRSLISPNSRLVYAVHYIILYTGCCIALKGSLTLFYWSTLSTSVKRWP